MWCTIQTMTLVLFSDSAGILLNQHRLTSRMQARPNMSSSLPSFCSALMRDIRRHGYLRPLSTLKRPPRIFVEKRGFLTNG
jgi:hypothetical protein